jgi:hypothetical protein
LLGGQPVFFELLLFLRFTFLLAFRFGFAATLLAAAALSFTTFATAM